jgi:DNA-binding response OmpR family regulator
MASILVIEDNVDLAFGLRNNLEIEGHDVDVAASGTRGLERARHKRPDLVLLDLMLPGLDGYRAPTITSQSRSASSSSWRGLRRS